MLPPHAICTHCPISIWRGAIWRDTNPTKVIVFTYLSSHKHYYIKGITRFQLLRVAGRIKIIYYVFEGDYGDDDDDDDDDAEDYDEDEDNIVVIPRFVYIYYQFDVSISCNPYDYTKKCSICRGWGLTPLWVIHPLGLIDPLWLSTKSSADLFRLHPMSCPDTGSNCSIHITIVCVFAAGPPVVPIWEHTLISASCGLNKKNFFLYVSLNCHYKHIQRA